MVPPVVGRRAGGSPAGLGFSGGTRWVQAPGGIRVPRETEGPRRLGRVRDPSRPRDCVRRWVKVSGDPTVTTKRVPLPWIGPRIEFIVRFPAGNASVVTGTIRRLAQPSGQEYR